MTLCRLLTLGICIYETAWSFSYSRNQVMLKVDFYDVTRGFYQQKIALMVFNTTAA